MLIANSRRSDLMTTADRERKIKQEARKAKLVTSVCPKGKGKLNFGESRGSLKLCFNDYWLANSQADSHKGTIDKLVDR